MHTPRAYYMLGRWEDSDSNSLTMPPYFEEVHEETFHCKYT